MRTISYIMGMRVIFALSTLRNAVGRPQNHLVPSQWWRWYGTSSCVNLVERGGAGTGVGLGAESGENFDSGVKNITNINSSWGFCFDIDGVLLRGKHLIPGVKKTLIRLQNLGVPFVFLTNGGGCTEEAKASDLTSKLGINISREMVILSHSPMRSLASQYRNRRVLVLGNNCKQIAEVDIGLQNVTTSHELIGGFPGMFPFSGNDFYVKKNFSPPKVMVDDHAFCAVMVLHDPLDWLVEAQAVLDVLRGGSPPGTGDGAVKRRTEMYISNPDFVFASDYPAPRLAAGSFADVVKMLYEKLCGEELQITAFGKPSRQSFDFAREQLERCNGGNTLRRIYMVGDNPEGDIRGANGAGMPWVSCLVRTGVFNCTIGNDRTNPAQYVFSDVNECVDTVVQIEK
eukprot:164567_1